MLLSFIVPLYVAADYASAWQFVPSILQIKHNFVEAMFGGLFYQGLKQASQDKKTASSLNQAKILCLNLSEWKKQIESGDISKILRLNTGCLSLFFIPNEELPFL